MTDNGAPDAPTGATPPRDVEPTPDERERLAKRELRTRLRAARRERRDATSPEQRHADGLALLHHLEPLLARATCVTSFEPLASESNLEPINAAVRARGRLLVPITLADLDLSWRDAATGDDLGTGGIAAADLVIAPALAIGPNGERLGQGGGCYDRALPRRRPGTPVVAVVFPDELLTGPDAPRIPVEAHDERVDAALTVDGLVRFGDALGY